VFAGTRVPIDAPISNLQAGLTLDEFLDNFPSVTREQALRSWSFQKARCCEDKSMRLPATNNFNR
jgi:uncharacterized protein (DUF433 family)